MVGEDNVALYARLTLYDASAGPITFAFGNAESMSETPTTGDVDIMSGYLRISSPLTSVGYKQDFNNPGDAPGPRQQNGAAIFDSGVQFDFLLHFDRDYLYAYMKETTSDIWLLRTSVYIGHVEPFESSSLVIYRPGFGGAAISDLAISAGPTPPRARLWNWQGDYVITNGAMNGAPSLISGDLGGSDPGIADNGHRREYSEVTHLSPTEGGYTDTGGDTIVGQLFYGGYEMITYDGPSPNFSGNNQVNQSGLVDRVRGQLNIGATGGRWAAVYMFLEPDFDTENVSTILPELNDIDFTYNNQGGSGIARFVVKDNGNFFVSEATFEGAAYYTLNSADTQWAPYDPNTDLQFDSTQTFEEMKFSQNIEGVGVYYGSDDVAPTVTQGDWRFREFSAYVSLPVPFRITSTFPDGTSFKFTFPSEAGKYYQAQYSYSLLPGEAEWFGMVNITGDGDDWEVEDDDPDDLIFYRIAVSDEPFPAIVE